MTTTISREQPFSVLATNFSISPSSSGYVLQVSADGINYTDLFAVGANITRMVTNVASGSYYKLSGNTDDNVTINWQKQCSDGQSGGGEGTGPQGPMGPQGVAGPQGPQGPAGSGGSGGSGDELLAVSDLGEGSDEGSVKASKSEIVGGTYWEEADWSSELSYHIHIDTDEQYGPESPLNLGDLDNQGDVSLFSFNYFYADGQNIVSVTYEFNGEQQTEYVVENQGPVAIPLYTSNEEDMMTVEYIDGLLTIESNQEISTLSLGMHINNKITEGQIGLWQWKSNPSWGEWIGAIGASIGDDKNGLFLCYDYLPESINGVRIADLMYGDGYGNNKYLYIDIDNMELHTYLSEDPTGNIEDTIYADGQTYAVGNFGIGDMRICWDNDKKFIRFDADYNNVKNVIVTTLDGEGWEAVVRNDYRQFRTNDQVIDGMPKWDNKGRIIGRTTGLNVKTMWFNNTSYNNAVGFLTNGTNSAPDRFWAPTSGGSQGQVLVSNGSDAAPTWATMIQAVRITSNAYAALVQAGTTDANTLYLIVD